MILSVVLLVALIVRIASGGSLRDVAEIRIRGEVLLVAAFVLVSLLPLAAGHLNQSRDGIFAGWIGLMVVLLALCLLNREVSQGFTVMGTGVALNLLAIALNRAMPVSIKAVAAIGGGVNRIAAATDIFHLWGDATTRLLILGDVLPLPGFAALRAVLSLGDVVMFVGLVTVVATHATSPVKRH